MVNLESSAHAAKALWKLVTETRSPFLTDIVRYIEPDVCVSLLRAFGQDGRTVSLLYRYAVADILRGQLDLTQCPALEGSSVSQAVLFLGEKPACLNAIRESGNVVTLRIVLELLHRFGCVIHYRDIQDAGTDVRRHACALIDSVLLNICSSTLSDSHVYLLVHSIRGLLDRRRVPRPAVIRMQQVEYFLNPLSRLCYYNVSPQFSSRSNDPDCGHSHLPTHLDTKSRSTKFRQLLTKALERKFEELQRPAECVERDIRAKARVFEIVSRLTERLFGTSPCLFGSGACGLATAASDMDVVVLQSRRLMRRMARVASLWKCAQQHDYCPFPSMVRVRLSPGTTVPEKGLRSSVTRQATEAGLCPPAAVPRRGSLFSMARRAHLGQWKWLQRSTREVAAIWSGRILGPRLARFGWSVECVESARVPILRVIAAVDSNGVPCAVNSNTADDDENKPLPLRRLFRSGTYLDPAVTVGKPKHWTGDVPDPSNPGHRKPFWELSRRERRAMNRTVQTQLDRHLEQTLGCPQEQWGVDSEGQPRNNLPSSDGLSSDIVYVSTDISFNHEVVVHNTRLMKAYAEIEPKLVPLGILVKHWAKQRGICDAYQGTLSGYQWMLMVIHYLQHFLVTSGDRTGASSATHPLPLLPNLQNPPPSLVLPQPQIVDERYDVFFYHPQRGLNRSLLPPSRFTAGLPDAPLPRRLAKSPGRKVLEERSTPCMASRWPEDLFKDNPYEYARNILSPLTICNSQTHLNDDNCNGRPRVLSVGRIPAEELQLLMRKYSCPFVRHTTGPDAATLFTESSSRCHHTPDDLRKLRFHGLVTQGDASLGTLLQEFFDYFGLRFNCYAYVVSISRTPQLPEKKYSYFIATSPFDSATTTGFVVNTPERINFKVADTPIVSSCVSSITFGQDDDQDTRKTLNEDSISNCGRAMNNSLVTDIFNHTTIALSSSSDDETATEFSYDTHALSLSPTMPLGPPCGPISSSSVAGSLLSPTHILGLFSDDVPLVADSHDRLDLPIDVIDAESTLDGADISDVPRPSSMSPDERTGDILDLADLLTTSFLPSTHVLSSVEEKEDASSLLATTVSFLPPDSVSFDELPHLEATYRPPPNDSFHAYRPASPCSSVQSNSTSAINVAIPHKYAEEFHAHREGPTPPDVQSTFSTSLQPDPNIEDDATRSELAFACVVALPSDTHNDEFKEKTLVLENYASNGVQHATHGTPHPKCRRENPPASSSSDIIDANTVATNGNEAPLINKTSAVTTDSNRDVLPDDEEGLNDEEQNDNGADENEGLDSQGDPIIEHDMPLYVDAAVDVSLDSLYGSDTESSCSGVSDTSDRRRRRETKLESRRALLASRIAAARTKYGLRQRPFLCILDPFEKDRTIGPRHRDGFTQLVFELLRARGILLEAEHRYVAEGGRGSSADVDAVVAELFAPLTHRPPYGCGGTPLDYRDSPYHHLVSSHYLHYERAHSATVRRINDHITAAAKKAVDQADRYHHPVTDAHLRNKHIVSLQAIKTKLHQQLPSTTHLSSKTVDMTSSSLKETHRTYDKHLTTTVYTRSQLLRSRTFWPAPSDVSCRNAHTSAISGNSCGPPIMVERRESLASNPGSQTLRHNIPLENTHGSRFGFVSLNDSSQAQDTSLSRLIVLTNSSTDVTGSLLPLNTASNQKLSHGSNEEPFFTGFCDGIAHDVSSASVMTHLSNNMHHQAPFDHNYQSSERQPPMTSTTKTIFTKTRQSSTAPQRQGPPLSHPCNRTLPGASRSEFPMFATQAHGPPDPERLVSSIAFQKQHDISTTPRQRSSNVKQTRRQHQPTARPGNKTDSSATDNNHHNSHRAQSPKHNRIPLNPFHSAYVPPSSNNPRSVAPTNKNPFPPAHVNCTCDYLQQEQDRHR